MKGADEYRRSGGTYCWSRYTTKSCLLLNFQASSWAATKLMERFFDSVIWWDSILCISVIIGKRAGEITI